MALFLRLLQWQLLLLLLIAVSSSSSYGAPLPIAKPNCKDECGNVKIPYPFGIGHDCYHNNNPFYEVDCRNTSNSDVNHHPTPFLKHYNLEILEIQWQDRTNHFYQLMTVSIPTKNICGSDGTAAVHGVSFEESPYYYSDRNEFIVTGCGGNVVFNDSDGLTLGGCSSLCPINGNGSATSIDIETSSCFGVGCCRFIPQWMFYSYSMTTSVKFNTCTLAAGLIGWDFVERSAQSKMFPTQLAWTIRNLTDDYFLGDDTFRCDNFSTCECNVYYEGNPYLGKGCKLVPECQKCRHHCSYDITYTLEHHEEIRYFCVNPLLQLAPILGFSISVGSVLLLVFCYWLYRVIRRKLEAKRKAKYFKRNGGLLLQQQMTSSDGSFDRTKVFRATELEKATNKFNKDRILGKGGQGTVYKGMLTDGKIVAIKKSNLVDEGQLDHFINELVILCQINHRNVVKLLGCCLETEVPLLVYEFIPNGTLYHLLHASPSEDFHLTWKMRLQIASESANALWYLHSSSATPIYHRDIKSSNILLDEKYRAKVSDFGTSKSITIEQTHVTTCVMGTYGYLDPEYFQSNQFTEKSDVYSFGVVLVELITGRKPICPTKSGGWISLAYEFLFHMETSRLFDMLDARVLEEGSEEELIAVANLARQCLHMSGKFRPSMKEIAEVLDGIRSHKLPISKEGNCGEIKHEVNEMGDMQSACSRANTFSLGNVAVTAFSIDVQPLLPNTF